MKHVDGYNNDPIPSPTTGWTNWPIYDSGDIDKCNQLTLAKVITDGFGGNLPCLKFNHF